jgi:hypothetical protein
MSVLSWNKLPSDAPDYLQPFLGLLQRLLKPREVIQLLVSRDGQYRANGYFNDPQALIRAILQSESQARALHVTLNPVRYSLLGAADNELRQPPGWIASNSDIIRRRSLRITFGPSHPIDAPNHQATLDRAKACRDFLTTLGWPEPILADNGEDADLLYAIDLLNDTSSDSLIVQILHVLTTRFSDDQLHLKANPGAAAACPIYGTLLSSPPNGPQRRSVILSRPPILSPLVPNLLESALRLPLAVADPQTQSLEQVDGNSVDRFVHERCILDPGAWLPTGVLYSAYQVFCYVSGQSPIPIVHFARALAGHAQVAPHRRKVQGAVTRGFQGIQLRT